MCNVTVANYDSNSIIFNGSTCKDSNPSDHTPFPVATPSFYGFVDDVQLLQSLQKPKKLTVIGDDGLEYSFLCKPKDDLRKDLRMMEFCGSEPFVISRMNKVARDDHIFLRTLLRYSIV